MGIIEEIKYIVFRGNLESRVIKKLLLVLLLVIVDVAVAVAPIAVCLLSYWVAFVIMISSEPP